MLSLLLLILLITLSSGQMLPPSKLNLSQLATPKEFPNGVVACGATFCDSEDCVMVIGRDGAKTYKCNDGFK